MKPKQLERENIWAAKGYVSVKTAAEKTHRGLDTVYRAIKAKDLEVIKDMGMQFVSIKSLIRWIGPDTARAYGLVK